MSVNLERTGIRIDVDTYILGYKKCVNAALADFKKGKLIIPVKVKELERQENLVRNSLNGLINSSDKRRFNLELSKISSKKRDLTRLASNISSVMMYTKNTESLNKLIIAQAYIHVVSKVSRLNKIYNENRRKIKEERKKLFIDRNLDEEGMKECLKEIDHLKYQGNLFKKLIRENNWILEAIKYNYVNDQERYRFLHTTTKDARIMINTQTSLKRIS